MTLRCTFFTAVRKEKQAPANAKSPLDEPYPDLSREPKPVKPVFETVRLDVSGAASRLEELCPGLSGTSKLDRSSMATWKKTRDAILAGLRNRIESADHKVEFIQIGQPGFDAPLAFLLVMLESVAELNIERDGSGKAAFEVGWRFQEAKGGYLDTPDSQTDPVPEDG